MSNLFWSNSPLFFTVSYDWWGGVIFKNTIEILIIWISRIQNTWIYCSTRGSIAASRAKPECCNTVPSAAINPSILNKWNSNYKYIYFVSFYFSFTHGNKTTPTSLSMQILQIHPFSNIRNWSIRNRLRIFLLKKLSKWLVIYWKNKQL